MKKSVWIFLLAVLLPSAVLGWLALRSAEEQQIVFERRTAELYQKETEALAGAVREAVEGERRVFGETVHRLLANGDAGALARDFTNTLADAWPRKAIGFVLGEDGKLLSPAGAATTKNPEWRRFLHDNRSFLSSSEPALVYSVQNDGPVRGNYFGREQFGSSKFKNQANISQYARIDELRAQNAVKMESRTKAFAGGKTKPGEILSPEAAPAARKPAAQPSARLAANKPDDSKRLTESGSSVATADKLSRDAVERSQSNQPVVATPSPALNGIVSVNKALEAAGAGLPRSPEPADVAAPKPASAPGSIEPESGKQTLAAAAGGLLQGISPQKEIKGAAAPAAPPASEPPAALARTDRDKDRLKNFAEGGNDLQKAQDPGVNRKIIAGRDPARLEEAQSVTDSAKDLAPQVAAIAERPAIDNIEFGKLEKRNVPGADRGVIPEKKRSVYEQAKAMIAPARSSARRAAIDGKLDASEKMRDESLRQEADGNIEQEGKLGVNRQVEPQQLLGAPGNALSAVMPETAEFRTLTEKGDEGIVSRFVQDKLELIFWLRPPEAPELVFGCLVEAANFTELWKGVIDRHFASSRGSYDGTNGQPGFLLALLDDRGHPAATRPDSVGARDWKRPFVASEIGEALPHWEAALYLASPTALADGARALWRTLAFTIAGAVALIALGGWLVVADARRQLALAQQKTDFVSNVSHELKTPLTSIRMFAELMQDRPLPPEKQGRYLRIITVEAERLTRLINNVLDFAKLGRKQKRFEKKPLDLHGVISRVWESQGLHLRETGFTTRWEAAPGPYPVLGDDDALAQVLVNLLSNAEKYSTARKEVELHTWIDDGWVNVGVLDRGMGVPNGEERKIFESFYRAHDSLGSGIQGSGLGLTLAQHVAIEHGGEIKFERRDGGGSRFTLRLPMSASPAVSGPQSHS